MRSALVRFLRKVRRNPKTGCWLWQGAVRTWRREPWDGGYPAFWFNGRVVRGHRWLYELVGGRIRRHQVLIHTCDVRRCVNPWHIYASTQRVNVADMISKGRMGGFCRVRPVAQAR